jgi:hypothetical protein
METVFTTFCWGGAGLLGLALSIGFGFQIYQERRLRQRLAGAGALVQGEITSHRVAPGRYTTVYVHYSYPVAGERYTEVQEVSAAHFNRLKDGQPVWVRYAPDQPAAARLADADQDGTGLVGMWVACIASLIVGLFLLGLGALLLWR